MKKLLLLAVIFFLNGFVISQTVGTIINQTTFDNQDFTVRDVDFIIDSISIESGKAVIDASYLTLVQREDRDWEVVRRPTEFTYFLEDYHLCRLEGNLKAKCVDLAEEQLIRDAKTFREKIRSGLGDNQTKSFVDELTVNDFTITNEQLNTP